MNIQNHTVRLSDQAETDQDVIGRASRKSIII